jgi:tetratricopeptide (TPR) repeat protein
MKGNILIKKKLYDEALKTFLAANKISEVNPGVKYAIGMLYYNKKYYLRASNYLGDAVNYNTENMKYKLHLVFKFLIFNIFILNFRHLLMKN